VSDRDRRDRRRTKRGRCPRESSAAEWPEPGRPASGGGTKGSSSVSLTCGTLRHDGRSPSKGSQDMLGPRANVPRRREYVRPRAASPRG
jgi:hypothetical protein